MVSPRTSAWRDRETAGRSVPDAAPWEQVVKASGSAAASQCEKEPTSPPAVAFCIAGAARTFTSKLILTHIRYNLIAAISGNEQGTRLFLHLKLNDSEKVAGMAGQRFRSHREGNLQQMIATLQLPWIQQRIGEAVVLNGSGTYEGEGCQRVSAACVVQPENQAWKAYRTQSCSTQAYTPGENRSTPCCAPQNHFIATGNNEERLLLSHMGIAWCGAAISRYEQQTSPSKSFGLVLYSRPDAVWWRPVPPWCTWMWNHEALSCDGPGCDMTWAVPRPHFTRLSRQHVMHRDCPARPRTKSRHVCCTTSEHLMTFGRTHGNATHVLPREEQLDVARIGSNLMKSMSVLRSTRGVCEIVMHPVLTVPTGTVPSREAGRFALLHERRSGMLAKTTVKLRALFIRNESSLDAELLATEMIQCRAALRPYDIVSIGQTVSANGDDGDMVTNDTVKWAEWATEYRAKLLRKFTKK